MTWMWCVLTAALVLLIWPWYLALLKARRPSWWTSLEMPAREELTAPWSATASPGAAVVSAWWTLAVLASLLPSASGWVAADLDSGLLWLAVLAGAGWLAHGCHRLRGRAAAGAVLVGLGAVVPVVLRVASLNLTDMVVAQQGGAGNWFLVREPFLLLSGVVYLLGATAIWQLEDEGVAAAVTDPWSISLRLGRPLVAAHLFSVLYLGGWWAFVPFMDGLPWLNTALKTVVVFGLMLSVRRRTWVGPALLSGWLPVAALLTALGSLIWLVVGGGVA